MSKLKDKIKNFFSNSKEDNIYLLDGAVPLHKAIPFGIQHVLSMFVANIVPLLLVFASVGTDKGATSEVISNGIRSAIFIAAIGTTIQLFPIWKIGSKLPIVVGLSFTFLGVLSLVGTTYGLSTMFISIIVGGLFIGIVGLFAKYWKRFIKPIVSATVILAIGLSLLTVGIKSFISYDVTGIVENESYNFSNAWPYLIVAFITLITCIVWQIFVKGIWKNISILIGLVVGYITALCFIPLNNMVDFSSFTFSSVTDFIDIPKPIFFLLEFKWSDFNIGAIVVVCLIYLVASTEGIGDITSLCEAGLNREPTDKEIAGGLSCDGFTSCLAGIFGALPLTTFSQNVGIVAQTKVINRFTIFMGVIILFLASFFPPIARFLMTIPDCVLGGCTLTLFASIVIVGMQMISKLGFNKKNIMILSLSLGLGYAITLIPEFYNTNIDSTSFLSYLMIIIQNPVANMFIISLILSYVIPESINKDDDKKEEI